MVSSNQHDVGTDSSSEHKELSLEERLEKVRRDAYAAGFAEGEVDGFIDGREQGFAAGYDESFAEGHAVGFTDGYKWGLSQGKLLGYGTGLRKGRYEGLDAGTSENHSGTRDHGPEHSGPEQGESEKHGQFPSARIQSCADGVGDDRTGRDSCLHGAGASGARFGFAGREKAQASSVDRTDVLRPVDQHGHL